MSVQTRHELTQSLRAWVDTEEGEPSDDDVPRAGGAGGNSDGARLQHLRPEHLASPPLFVAPPYRRARSERGAALPAPDVACSLPAGSRRGGGGGTAGAGTKRRRVSHEREGGSGGGIRISPRVPGGAPAPSELDCLSPPARRERRLGSGEALGCGGASPLPLGGTPPAATPRSVGGDPTGYDRQTWEALLELGCAPTPRSASRGGGSGAFDTPGGLGAQSRNPGSRRGDGSAASDLLSPPLVFSGSARKRCAPDIGNSAGAGGDFRRVCGGGPDGTLFSPQPLVAKRARTCGSGDGDGSAEGKCRQVLGLGFRALAAGEPGGLEHLVRPLCMSPGLPGVAPAVLRSGINGSTPTGLADLGHVRASTS